MPNAIERYNICRNVQGYYKNFNISAQLNHAVTKEQLSHALRILCNKYPVFACQFVRKDGTHDETEDYHNWDKVLLDRVVFEDVVEYRQIESFDSTVLSTISDIAFPMNSSKPLWRLVVCENEQQYLSFVTDHTLLDGNTGVFFFQDLVRELDGIDGPVFEQVLFEKNGHSVPLAAMDSTEIYRAPFMLKLKAVAGMIKDFFAPKVFSFPHKTQKNKIVMVHIDAQKMHKIKQKLRENSLTFTPFLHGLVHEVVVDLAVKESSVLKHCVAANSRHYYKQYDLRYTFAVGGFYHLVPTDFTLLECAQSLSDALRGVLADKSIFQSMGLLNMVNIGSYLKERKGFSTITGSNLGYNEISCGEWAVENMWFCQNCTYLDEFSFDAISTKNGMNLSFGWLEDYNIEGFEEVFLKRLDDFSSERKRRINRTK